jgi:hypothetical protein
MLKTRQPYDSRFQLQNYGSSQIREIDSDHSELMRLVYESHAWDVQISRFKLS